MRTVRRHDGARYSVPSINRGDAMISGKRIVIITREEFAREMVIHGWIMPADVPALKAKGLR
jgi:hypothetical protein